MKKFEKKRLERIQEFTVPKGKFTAAKLGAKNLQILCAGDDQSMITMWLFNKPAPRLSLSGHTSDVTSICFSTSEKEVYSGSFGGTILIHDLESQKLSATLSGHRTNCTSLAPFREPSSLYLVSGSVDTNVKLWDLRKKSCALTYKEHKQPVSCVAFSPDHRWIASGSLDGTVKLWDSTASKSVADFTVSDASVTCLEFNPQDVTLANGSSDKTVKYWDLQERKILYTTTPDSTPVQSLAFSDDGDYLYTCSRDSLKVWDLQKNKLLDVIMIPRGSVTDIKISELDRYMLLNTIHQSTMSVYAMALEDINYDPDIDIIPTQEVEYKAKNDEALMKSSVEMQPPPNVRATRNQDAPIKQNVFENNLLSAKQQESNMKVGEDYVMKNVVPGQITTTKPPMKKGTSIEPSQPVAMIIDSSNANELANYKDPTIPQKENPSSSISSAPASGRNTTRDPKQQVQNQKVDFGQSIIQAPNNEPTGLDMNSFLNTTAQTQKSKDMEIISTLSEQHQTLVGVITRRQNPLKVILKWWSASDINSAINAFKMIGDLSVVKDVLSFTIAENVKTEMLTLENVAALLPHTQNLIDSKYEPYILTGIKSVSNILKAIGDRIISAKTTVVSNAVDLAREERLKKCDQCIEQFGNILKSQKLVKASTRTFESGSLAKKLIAELEYFMKACTS